MHDKFLIKGAEKYTMNFPFNVEDWIIKENNVKIITGFNRPVHDSVSNQISYNKIKFDMELEYSKFADVINFLLNGDCAGEMKQYLKSIKEFFDMLINDKQPLKLYKKKVLKR